MKYMGMPMGMWALFAGSFQKQLTAVFGYDADAAQAITKKAKPKYKAIIADLPEFEKSDRFKMNIVNCAMLGAFILSMPQRPAVDRLTDYYAKAMMTAPMQWFCRKSGKSKFTAKDITAMKATAALKAAFDFMEQAFAESQEMVVFVTELTVNPASHQFLTENGCERYFKYNKDLLLDHRKAALQQELAAEQRRHGGV